MQKAGLVGLATLGAALLWSGLTVGLSAASVSAWSVLILGASFLVGSAFPGYSPYWQ